MAKQACRCFKGRIALIQGDCVTIEAREGKGRLKAYLLRATPIKVNGKNASPLSLTPGMDCDVWMTMQNDLLGLDCREKIPEGPKLIL